MLKNPDAILSGSSKFTRGRGLGRPRDSGDRGRVIGREFKELTENGTDASLVGRKRGREMSDDKNGRSSVSDP